MILFTVKIEAPGRESVTRSHQDVRDAFLLAFEGVGVEDMWETLTDDEPQRTLFEIYTRLVDALPAPGDTGVVSTKEVVGFRGVVWTLTLTLKEAKNRSLEVLKGPRVEELPKSSEVFRLNDSDVRMVEDWEAEPPRKGWTVGWRGACLFYAGLHGRAVAVRDDGSVTVFVRTADGRSAYSKKRVRATVLPRE